MEEKGIVIMKTTLAAALLLLTAGTSPALAQQKVDERRPAAANGLVEIESPAGSLRVVGWARAEVTVTGTLGPGAEGLSLTGEHSRVRVEVETRGNPHGVTSTLEVHVPEGSRVEIESFGGSIVVEDVKGTVRAENVNGNITVSGAAREVDVQTVNGSLDVKAPARRVRAESVNGSVSVKGATGVVEASTVNGSLDVAGGAFSHTRLETVNGRVQFDGDLARNGILDAESVSGAVELTLPASVAADFTLSTFSGAVTNELGPALDRTGGHDVPSEKELSFTTGAGGATVTIHTLSGAIAIRKR
jgi:DUF4097 and DUF4098 domain-containing protein YvlB